MAVGSIIDYEPLDIPGAYDFIRSDGSRRIGFGEGAEELKRALDRQRVARGPDLRLAQPSLPTGREDERLGMSVPDVPPAMSLQPPQPSQPPMSVAPLAPPAVQTSAGQPPAAPVGAPPATQARNAADQALAYATRKRVVPGRPTITTQDLETQAQQARPMPQAAQTTIEHGLPLSQEQLQQQLEGQRELLLAHRLVAQENAERAAQAAERERQAELERAAAIAERVRVQQDRENEINQRVERERQQYNQRRREFRESRVDPNRIFSGVGGTISAISATIGQALGAYAATLGRTPNFAQQIVQAAIDRDIAAQEEEIRIRGLEADNALSQLTRSTGDLKTARITLEQLQHDYAASVRAQIAAQSKREDVLARHAEWDILAQRDALEREQRLVQQTLPRIREVVDAQMRYPQQGRAATLRDPTAKEIAADLANVGTAVDIGQKSLGLDKTAAETEKIRADAAKARAGGEMPAETARVIAKTDSAIDQLVAIAEKYGYKVDRTTGKITETEDSRFPGRGPGGMPLAVPGVATGGLAAIGVMSGVLPPSPEWQEFATDMTTIGRLTAGVLNPEGEPSQPLMDRVTPDPTAPDANIKAQLESNLQSMLTIRKNWAANSTPEQRSARDTQKRQVGQEQRESPVIVSEEPF